MRSNKSLNRTLDRGLSSLPLRSPACGVGAILGVVILVVSTALHPLEAHPGDAPTAFAEYALDGKWVGTHLGQLVGVVLIAAGFVALSWKLRTGRAGAWALLAGLAAVVSVSLAAALQAVDGVALKFMVDRWDSTSVESRAVVFEAAYGVRQIEVGFASLLGAFFGLTVVLYGVAFVRSPVGVAWVGIFGIITGTATLVASVVQAYAGFSDIAMRASMPSSILLLLWSLCIGVLLLRKTGASEHAA